MKAIRAVTLDVGGTLIEPWPSVGEVYSSVAGSFGCSNVNPAQLSEAFGKAWKGRQDFDYTRAAWRQVVDATFMAVTDFKLSQACFDSIYERFGRGDAWRVYEDVGPFLETARRRGIRLALVSNWDERLRGLLTELKLASAFETIVVSHEVGFRKPAREIFLCAAERLGLSPGEIFHVGDSEREDVRGAREAGLEALWLRREGVTGQGVIRSLREIGGLIGKLEG